MNEKFMMKTAKSQKKFKHKYIIDEGENYKKAKYTDYLFSKVTKALER